MTHAERLLLPHLQDLYQTAIRLTCGDSLKAEHLVESAYTEVLRDRGWEKRPRTFLFRAAIRLGRKQSVSGTAVVARSVFDMLGAVDALPLDLREAILLVDCMDFCYGDACDALEVKLDLLTSRLRQARSRIQQRAGREAERTEDYRAMRC